jgi:tetratricopeptide (TPR) repeat protein
MDRLRGLKPTPLPLHLSVDRKDDELRAVEYGAVCDGKRAAEQVNLGSGVRFVLRAPGGPINGFTVKHVSHVIVDALPDLAWRGPRFHVPLLGLPGASLGEILLGVEATVVASTADVCFFHLAVHAGKEGELDRALAHWQSCLEAGDMRGHFGLGYTLFDLGRPREAYGHLRRYTELTPHNSWAWLWLGRAAESLGRLDEACTGYRLAVRLEQEGSFATDASKRLLALESSLRDTRA